MIAVDFRTQEEKEQKTKFICSFNKEPAEKDPIIELCEKIAVMNILKLPC